MPLSRKVYGIRARPWPAARLRPSSPSASAVAASLPGPATPLNLPGELSVGDVVAVALDGEVRLAAAKIGWTPVPAR
jgi:hypothetical protein